MTKAEFTLRLEMDDNDTFMVTCKEHPPFTTYGETPADAFERAGIALAELDAFRPLLVHSELVASGQSGFAAAFAEDHGLV